MTKHAASQHHPRGPPLPEPPEQSTISRLLITPLTLISFVISLCLIDSHNHSSRIQTHWHPASHSAPPTTLYGRTKAFLHSLVFKRQHVADGSPYAYVRDPSAPPAADGKVGMTGDGALKSKTGPGGLGKEESWHWHTQQKKMMRAEVSDAFRIRKWVVAVLLLGVGSAFAIGVVLLRWIAILAGRWLMTFKGELMR